ncbi:hypothetical protein [Phaffia rhodozyma]|uniref:Uncharacterized protein n=1 Tax=Phaffia rhodozyma TaxID=264483 RepID=A0A0F7SG83_PHARH|nr:hypothetical protein [Phaffia rhodozyma]
MLSKSVVRSRRSLSTLAASAFLTTNGVACRPSSSSSPSKFSQPKHKLLDKLIRSAGSSTELNKAVRIVQEWTQVSLPPTEVTLAWLNSLLDRARDLNDVPFSLDVLSDPITYGLNLPSQTPPSIFRKLLYNLLHPPVASTSTTSDHDQFHTSRPSRVHLNAFMDLANRHAPGDPLILLLALEGYISLWEEGIGRRVWIEQEIRHYRNRWIPKADGGDIKLTLNAEESAWMINTLDNLRPFVADALLESWGRLEMPDPGVSYLEAHTQRANLPLTSNLLAHYIHLPLHHHPTDPFIILSAIHLYSLDLPRYRDQIDNLLNSLPNENPWAARSSTSGTGSGRELSPVERTRMRSSLDRVGSLLGDKKIFWESFDPVDVEVGVDVGGLSVGRAALDLRSRAIP